MADRKKAGSLADGTGRGDVDHGRRGALLGRPGPLLAGCLGVAVGIVLAIVYFTPPDSVPPSNPSLEPGPAPPASEPALAGPTITLPATASAATAEQLQQEAVEVAEQLLERFPELPEALHVAAMLYLQLHQTGKAEAIWRRCVELAPGDAGPRVGLAGAVMERGEDQAAVEILQQGLSLGCSSAQTYHQLATALTKLGKLEAAEEALQKGVAAFPPAPENWLLLGQTQIQLGQFAEAEACLRKAVTLRARSADVYFALANACARQGKHEEAAEFRARFSELKAHEPQETAFQEVYSGVLRAMLVRHLGEAGAVYARQADPAEAERLFLRVLALDPGRPEILRELAGLYVKQGRLADAQVVQVRLVEVEPQSVLNYVNLASVSARLRDYESAEAALKRAMVMRPDLALPYLSLARLYLQTGRPDQARWFAESAVRQQPTVEGYTLLAVVCQRLGDQAAAEAAWQTARKAAPADAPQIGAAVPQQP